MEVTAMADLVYVNFEEGVNRVMNNAKLYIKLITKFKTENNLNDLSAALGANDYEKAQVAAHTMKGIAANLSLTELFEKSKEIEAQIKEKSVQAGELEKVQAVFDETIKEVEKVIAQHG
jgi:HPt (histidine-containing phosphotransfer) domain-containing protein